MLSIFVQGSDNGPQSSLIYNYHWGAQVGLKCGSSYGSQLPTHKWFFRVKSQISLLQLAWRMLIFVKIKTVYPGKQYGERSQNLGRFCYFWKILIGRKFRLPIDGTGRVVIEISPIPTKISGDSTGFTFITNFYHLLLM